MELEPVDAMSQTPADVRMTVEERNRSSSLSLDNPGYLYVTPFHLECGPDRTRLMVHKELMCSVSPYIRRLCDSAQQLKGPSAVLTSLCGWFEKNLEKGNAGAINVERVDVLARVWNNKYNLGSSRKDLKNLLKNQTNSMYMNTKMRESKNAPGGLATNPGPEDTPGRLRLLKAVAVKKVADSFYETLKALKRAESESLVKDPIQAVVHDSIVLEDTSSKTAQMMIQWIYAKTLPDEIGTTRLCELYQLGVKFHMEPFKELIMERIVSCVVVKVEGRMNYVTAIVAVPNELKFEPSMQSLDSTLTPAPQTSSLADSLELVLGYVCQHREAPWKLKNLVVEALAWSASPVDLAVISDRLPRVMALMLAQALLERLTDLRTNRVEVSLMERLKLGDERMKSESGN